LLDFFQADFAELFQAKQADHRDQLRCHVVKSFVARSLLLAVRQEPFALLEKRRLLMT
jgi:hypothetical protein